MAPQKRKCAPAGVALLCTIALAACGGPTVLEGSASRSDEGSQQGPISDLPVNAATAGPSRDAQPLDWAIAGRWRSADEKTRDGARNPRATLSFFGVEPSDTVIELWPGGGWYTSILAPYLATGDGRLVAAHFDPDAYQSEPRARIEARIAEFAARYERRPDLFGTVQMGAFSGRSGQLVARESADVVLTFRNLHNWMAGGYADKAFADAFAALKPGGILGVVEHRLPSSSTQDPLAMTGYVHEDYVKAAAERAGFAFVASSEINANPRDNADHPFGVWTLPPNSRTQDRDGQQPEEFDPAVFVTIGESDRMTLKFQKPLANGTVPLLEDLGTDGGADAP